jgi:DNA-3-methyladenine glycosylase I
VTHVEPGGLPTASSVIVGADGRARCWWCVGDAEYERYHDEEWGRPVIDEVRLFEKLCLEAFQSGLSWLTILRKRAAFRSAFAGFEPARVAAFDDGDVARLLADARIVRNRAKIEATVSNARTLIDLHAHGETLTELLWGHAPTAHERPAEREAIPATTRESTLMARALKARGFRFVGPTTCYALMQAMGMVDDHVTGCHVEAIPLSAGATL